MKVGAEGGAGEVAEGPPWEDGGGRHEAGQRGLALESATCPGPAVTLEKL